MDWLDDEVVRARTPERLPTVFSREEARAVLAQLDGTAWLAASLMYGSGLRLMECLRLRVKDIDFDQVHIIVRDGKGRKDRATLLPASSIEPLRRQIEHVHAIHDSDLRDGFGRVHLPHALAVKYPEADRQPGWQYLFPSGRRAVNPRTGIVRRHHLAESALQKAVKRAIRAAGVIKPASCHTFRHSFATHLLESGTISAPSRSCSATRTSAPRWSIPTSSNPVRSASAARSTPPEPADPFRRPPRPTVVPTRAVR